MSKCSVILFSLCVYFMVCVATIIIVEDAKACFRRVLAGKRVGNRYVQRTERCERVEDCQQECADEKRFVCEGFNYRLDSSGRGQGICELLDLPLSRLDIGRDLYPDPDYDYYERDRNAGPGCKDDYSNNYRPHGGGFSSGNRYNYADRFDGHRVNHYGHRGGQHNGYDAYRGSEHSDGGYYGRPRPRPSIQENYGPETNRRGDYDYHQTYHSQTEHENTQSYGYSYGRGQYDQKPRYGHHYPGVSDLPNGPEPRPQHRQPPYEYKSYEPYIPAYGRHHYRLPYDDRYKQVHKYYHDREKDRNYWGVDKQSGGWGSYGGLYGNFGRPDSYLGSSIQHQYGQHRNKNRQEYGFSGNRHHYTPNEIGGVKDWGAYGGSYGTGGQHHVYGSHRDSYDFWGLDRHRFGYDQRPYLEKPVGVSYLPPSYDDRVFSHGSFNHKETNYNHVEHEHFFKPTALIPPRVFEHDGYSFLKDECSLRSATGFRLHKTIIRKYFHVPNIYECELLCFRERDLPCNSYAYRYTISLSAPTDNCYLSNRNYKELDFYTDLEPDHDFDIYTMNNNKRCEQPMVTGRHNSDCFWRVRSSQRLHESIVKDSLNVKSIAQCQIECLRCIRFTCRAFSFRYGSPIIGGSIDNCQLTDWPYLEMDPRIHLIPEPGYELYERGSYGHGCEPNHFSIGGRYTQKIESQADQLCYVGYGAPARLLPQATKKSMRVDSEIECKKECTKARETSFMCMCFSYSPPSPKQPYNCYLSDIMQRDLLSDVDYLLDRNSWLFAWDNYNPKCVALANEYGYPQKEGHRDLFDSFNALDTWRVYSVSGWPCRRGSLCQENQEAGFWFCHLEGGDLNSWDYCCTPNHQCGYSEGFPYQWCYVGPAKSQWRKCSDRYYPYLNIHTDRHEVIHQKPYLPQPGYHYNRPVVSNRPDNSIQNLLPPHRPGFRPDRRPGPPPDSPVRPTLDEYEMQFDSHFLDPPKPGGFGQARHWPVSYLHKDMPPNTTSGEQKFAQIATDTSVNPKFTAIENLINIIKSNDLKNFEYQITNNSNKEDDILFVKIPLPANINSKSEKMVKLDIVDDISKVDTGARQLKNATKSSNSSVDEIFQEVNMFTASQTKLPNIDKEFRNLTIRSSPIYRRSYITKTNKSVS